MGLLGKLLRKPVEPEALVTTVCSHRNMIARWDNAEHIGQDDRVTGYKCETCSELFTTAAGREIMSLV